jgi:transposase
LKDGRQENGNEPILSDRQQEKLQRALSKDPPDRGLWTGPKVAHWISQELNRPVSAVTGWHYLVRMGWSLQIPRRQHSQSATPEEQDAFKKNFSSGSKICARRIRTRG